MFFSRPSDNESLLAKIQMETNLEIKERLTSQFWENVRKTGGGPLLKLQENGEYKVIFLYRSDQNNLDVKLDCLDLRERFIDDDDQPKKFMNLAGTDIYYLEVNNIPATTFIPYEIEVGDKSISDALNFKDKFRLCIYDAKEQSTSQLSRESSLLILPKAVLPEWNRINPAYSTNKSPAIGHELFVDAKGKFGTRDIWIQKPENYEPANARIVFMLDGEGYIKLMPPYMDYLKNNELQKYNAAFENTVIVYISNVHPESVPNRRINGEPINNPALHRVYEFFKNDTDFSAFIANEIIPQFCQKLGVSNDPVNVTLAGFSLSAYCAANTAIEHHDKIGNIVLVSGAFNNTHDIASKYEKKKDNTINVHMTVGQFEDHVSSTKNQIEQELTNESRLASVLHLYDVLNKKGHHATIVILPVGHSQLTTLTGISAGFEFTRTQNFTQNQTRRNKR